jgi:hypothetical protein
MKSKLTEKEIKKITKAVIDIDNADWKIMELAWRYLGKSIKRKSTVRDALYDFVIMHHKLLTKAPKNVQ